MSCIFVAGFLPPMMNSIRSMLDMQWYGYSTRQLLYGTVLNDSQIFKEMTNFMNNHQLNLSYAVLFIFSVGFYVKDLSRRPVMEKLVERGILSKNTIRSLEIVLFVLALIFTKDVDNAI